MDQESEGTSLVIFVVGGVVVLLLLLGAGAFWFLGMPSYAEPVEEPPAMEVPKAEVHEGPVQDEPIRPKKAQELPKGPGNQPPPGK
jgi:hypothetical protein